MTRRGGFGLAAAAVAAAALLAMIYVWLGLRPPEPAAVPPRGGVIADVTILTPGGGRLTHQSVVVSGSAIVDVRPATPEERSHDGAVRYVVPGLIDMHVHQPVSSGGLDDYFSLLYLRHGVTGVRDMGYSYPEVLERRDRIRAGERPGPRIFTCGPIIDGAPPAWETSEVLTSAAAAAALVERLRAQGVDCLKVYSGLGAAPLAALKSAARAAGLPVVGHVPRTMPLEAAELDDVQHLTGIAGAAAAEANALSAGWSELTEERVRRVAEAALHSGSAHTPTLTFLDVNSRRLDHDALAATESAWLMPRMFRDVVWRPGDAVRLGGERSVETEAALRRAYQRGLEVVGRLHREGVAVHAGTDTGNPFVVPGAALLRELELLVEAGLTPAEALQAATAAPGEFLGGGLGSLRAGAPADLLVLREDPTLSVAALHTVDTVVADGRFYSRAALEAEIARYRAHFGAPVWDVLVPWLFTRSD